LALAAAVVNVVVVMQSLGAGAIFDNIVGVCVDDFVFYGLVGLMFLWVNGMIPRLMVESHEHYIALSTGL
jgi:hypothetical protein